MKKIQLTQGKFALVDNEDFESLSKFKWCTLKTGYGGYRAVRNRWNPATKRRHMILMHRQIVNCPQGLEVDHADHDTLNNQRSNLRICTRSQNMANGLSHKGSSSKYKGCSWHKQVKKWQATIYVNGKKISLSYFDSEIEAAKAYDKAAIKYFGEFACLNFPEERVYHENQNSKTGQL